MRGDRSSLFLILFAVYPILKRDMDLITACQRSDKSLLSSQIQSLSTLRETFITCQRENWISSGRYSEFGYEVEEQLYTAILQNSELLELLCRQIDQSLVILTGTAVEVSESERGAYGMCQGTLQLRLPEDSINVEFTGYRLVNAFESISEGDTLRIYGTLEDFSLHVTAFIS